MNYEPLTTIYELSTLFRCFLIEIKSQQAENYIGCPGGQQWREIAFCCEHDREPAEKYIEHTDHNT